MVGDGTMQSPRLQGAVTPTVTLAVRSVQDQSSVLDGKFLRGDREDDLGTFRRGTGGGCGGPGLSAWRSDRHPFTPLLPPPMWRPWEQVCENQEPSMEPVVFQSHMVRDLSPGPSVSCLSQEKSPKKDGLCGLSKGFLSLLSLSSHRPSPSLHLSLEEEVARWLDLLGVLTSLDHTGG